jgi:hypothetical protein
MRWDDGDRYYHGAGHYARTSIGVIDAQDCLRESCPFLALSAHQRATNGRNRYKANVETVVTLDGKRRLTVPARLW